MKNATWFVLLLSLSLQVHAEKLDLETHSSLISKLESVVDLSTKDAMVSQLKISKRLADLYAERARLLSLQHEGKAELLNQKQIDSDRRKSLSILTKVTPSLDKSERGYALMQTAHLHELLGESTAAFQIYKKIEKEAPQHSPQVVALTHIQLGDVAFGKGQLTESQKQFEASLKYKENPRRGYALFRLAWTSYSRGQTKLAEQQLTQLLKNPDHFKSASGVEDVPFREEVSHDLATFIARNDLSANSISDLSQLSPDSTRRKNLIYLATELDRTAKKQSALRVWALIGTQEMSFEDQLERQVHVTRIQYDLARNEQLLIEIDKTIALLKSEGCQKDNQDCVVARQNLRKIITDWGKAAERVPTPDLVSAYLKYTLAFDDHEMNYWAAQAARKRKMYKAAVGFYRAASRSIYGLEAAKKGTPQTQRFFEGSLLGAIEVAELSNDPALRLQSYQEYLELNPKGNKAAEVRYQIAHWYYEQNQYAKASEEFRLLVLDTQMPQSLREKSADLSLDADAILKNDAVIEVHSLEYSRVLKSKEAEYASIWRKSILNQTARAAQEKAQDPAVLEKELKKNQSLNLAAWPAPQRKQILQNRISLAYRLKDLEALSQASRQFLAEKGLTTAERNMALEHLAWIAETKMNFGEALIWTRQMTPQKADKSDHLFKIAMLKELSGHNPTVEFQNFLAASGDAPKRQYAAHQIILYSRNPMKDFRKFEHLLSSNLTLWRSTALSVYERTKDASLARRLMGQSAFRSSAEGKLLSHVLFFQEFEALKSQIARVELRNGSDAKIQRQMAQRTQLLKQLERQANQAIAQRDTSLQLIELGQLAEEKVRLANQILTLPIPRSIPAAQRPQYQAQVRQLVAPYIQQSNEIRAKVSQLWQQAISKNVFQDIYDWSLQGKPGSQMAAAEVHKLRASARQAGFTSDPFESFSDQRRKTVSEASSLQRRLKDDPFNFNDLEKMKSVQSSLGSGPMVAYLDGRLKELRQRGGTN